MAPRACVRQSVVRSGRLAPTSSPSHLRQHSGRYKLLEVPPAKLARTGSGKQLIVVLPDEGLIRATWEEPARGAKERSRKETGTV